MPRLFYQDSKETIGEISEQQLQALQQLLVKEDSQDQDYYINKDTLEMLADAGLEQELLSLLKQALGDKEEMDIAWSAS